MLAIALTKSWQWVDVQLITPRLIFRVLCVGDEADLLHETITRLGADDQLRSPPCSRTAAVRLSVRQQTLASRPTLENPAEDPEVGEQHLHVPEQRLLARCTG